MTRTFDVEFVTRHLAGLAALEAAIALSARTLVNSFPAVSKVERPGESPEVATARDLVDQCDYFRLSTWFSGWIQDGYERDQGEFLSSRA